MENSDLIYTDATHVGCVGRIGGHIVFQVDHLTSKSYKIRRVVRSTLAAEALNMEEGLEDMMYLRAVVGELMGKELIVVYIDNRRRSYPPR